jgi:UDP-2-acetamido-2,6-beta-L-arabino-hexul-4-ose reductase
MTQLSASRILVTGSNGFIGKNLVTRLGELPGLSVNTFVRGEDSAILPELVSGIDAVVHLAGENRPSDDSAFEQSNYQLTDALCEAIRQKYVSTGRHTQLIFASSTQADKDNPYGRSKLAAEQAISSLAEATGNPCVIFRLPGVFGKWCKPNYNSVVATFCYNIARNLPIVIHDSDAALRLVYVDDVITAFLAVLEEAPSGVSNSLIHPEYTTTLGELAEQIYAFGSCRSELITERVGSGLTRALYATYISYLPSDEFSYGVTQHADARGVFVEMLKTFDSGQFSYFTAYPGVTRGGHYHHSKTEKFLVVKGRALFRFRHLISDEVVQLQTSGDIPQVVDTIPGWTHDITNIGDEEMVVMLWANENFDVDRPDTFASEI